MKKIILIITTIIFITSCEDADVLPKEHPFILLERVQVNAESVELFAEIKNLGQHPIKNYGFIWSLGSEIDSSMLYLKNMETNAQQGDFTFEITSDLEVDTAYTARPFIQSEVRMVLGNSITFESKGAQVTTVNTISPDQGDLGDTITIRGHNFALSKSRTEVIIGENKAEVIAVADNEINFIIPASQFKTGKNPVKLKSGKYPFILNDSLTIVGHSIENFYPTKGVIGESEIIINGHDFLETGNIVTIGSYHVDILEENNSQIKIRLPYTIKVGLEQINVIAKDKKASSEERFEILSRWKRLEDFPGKLTSYAPFAAVVNDKLFVISSYDDITEVWTYDFKLNKWDLIGNFPGRTRSRGTGFGIGNNIYYGLGEYDDFWSFNTNSQLWTEEESLHRVSSPIAESVGDKGYLFGGRYRSNIYEFTEGKAWLFLQYLSFDLELIADNSSYFNYNDKLYILESKGNCCTHSYKLLEFSPNSSDKFKLISIAPFENRRYAGISFALEEYYVGEGSIVDDPIFLRYNFQSNIWTRIENFQGGRRASSSISFSYQGKGYAGLGSKNDFWVYDPNLYSNSGENE